MRGGTRIIELPAVAENPEQMNKKKYDIDVERQGTVNRQIAAVDTLNHALLMHQL